MQFKTKPFAHQLTALSLMKNAENYGLFMEMGTGKSKVAIDDLADLYRQGLVRGALIVGNKGSYLNWLSTQIPDHMPDDIKMTLSYWDGKLRYWGHPSLHPEPPLRVLVMNIEALAFPRAWEEARNFLRANSSVMIVDESTTIKNQKAKRTKATISLGKLAKYRRILTGSPITKNPLDLYAQCEFLAKGLLGYTSFFAFRARYAEMFEMGNGQRSFKVVRGFKNLGELTEKLGDFSYRVTKAECLDLPEKTYERRAVELTQEQTKLYKQLKDEAMAELSETDVVYAPLAITKMLRLHQVICGHLPDSLGQSVPLKDNRLAALLDLLDECSGKVVIWATYTADINEIVNALTVKYEEEENSRTILYNGETTSEARASAVKDFQENPDYRFFVGNPKVGGYGITLHAASIMIFYSNDFNLETRLQAEDRIHRIGQKNACTYIDLVSPGTIDEKIIDALRNKKNVAGEVLGDKWKAWL